MKQLLAMYGKMLMLAFCLLCTMHTPAFSANTNVQNEVQQLYVGYLGRGADQAGLDYWVNEISTGVMTMEQLRANLTNEQPEYLNAYGGLSREDLVRRIYQNLFEREPEADGLAYWAYGGGASVNADQLIVAFLNAPSASDQTVLNNKLEVAVYYTDQRGGSDFNQVDAINAIDDVDGTATSVAAGKSYVDNLGGGNPGTVNIGGYPWVLYDDFSDNILNAQRWTTVRGNPAEVIGGRLYFTGDENIAIGNNLSSGVRAELELAGNTDLYDSELQLGLNIVNENGDGPLYNFRFELTSINDPSQAMIMIAIVDERDTNNPVADDILLNVASAQFDRTYSLAIVRNNDIVEFYIDDVLVHEYEIPADAIDLMTNLISFIGCWADSDHNQTARGYFDNVRVL